MILFSALFYAYSGKYFLALLFFTITQDYILSKKIEESGNNKHRKLILIYSIISNLSILFLLKYFNFFSNSANEVSKLFGGKSNPFYIDILLPAGISFYTFQSMSYVIDVYKKEIPASKNWLNYAFYLSFFPQLVAGPIVTAKEFYPEIEKFLTIKFAEIPLKKAFYFILLGFIKKSVLADNISVIVDFCFKEENIPVISSASLIIGMFSYSIQIYCDFSGYTDLAIGIALLFGILHFRFG
jgi:alginate O-acetyltransferase complex protein AlgI